MLTSSVSKIRVALPGMTPPIPLAPSAKQDVSIGSSKRGRTGGARHTGEFRGDSQLALLANLHAQQALVPALDDLALTGGEGQRVTAVVAGVELLAIREGALVVDADGITCGSGEVMLEYGSMLRDEGGRRVWRRRLWKLRIGAWCMPPHKKLTLLGLAGSGALAENLDLEAVKLGDGHLG